MITCPALVVRCMIRPMKRINNKGVSLVELFVTVAILSVLASLILPSVQLVTKRTNEIELRRNLREIRTAIDEYHKAYVEAVTVKKTLPPFSPADPKSSGYPESLQVLVEGFDFGDLAGNKRKFLRRIPIDPFNRPEPGEEAKWGYIGYADPFDTPPRESPEDVDGGVFDVVSLSEDTAIDETKYSEW